MTRYPWQVDREYLPCRSGSLDEIQMVDGGALDLHQDLVACDRRRRHVVEHQLPTVFQQADSFHVRSPESAQWAFYALCRSAFQSSVFAQDSKSWKATSGNSRWSAALSTV